MTDPSRLWVNPEGVVRVGDTYADHATMYDQHIQQLQALRSQYQDAWGNDDTGKKFSAKFLSGLDSLENLIGGVKGRLEYTAESLRAGGRLYREVDDDALDASHHLNTNFSELSAHIGGSGPAATASARDARTGASAPDLLADVPGGRLVEMTPRTGHPITPATPSIAATGVLSPTAGNPLSPMTAEMPAGTLLPSTETPLSPMTSEVPAVAGYPAGDTTTPATPDN